MLGDQFNHCLYRDENSFAIGRSDRPTLPVLCPGIGVALMPAHPKGSGVVNVYISDFDMNRTIGMRWLAQSLENN
jgi:hypothetical protein